jgi:type II pantothenate kinase
MVANSLPAINDITAPELRSLLSAAAEMCPIIRAALTAARKQQGSGSGGLGGAVPPYPGYRQRQPSHQDLSQLARWA